MSPRKYPLRRARVAMPLLLGWLGTTQPIAAQTKVAEDTPSPDSAYAIDEIVITARKQEESLQEVPLSVVAVSGDELERRSVESLGDLGQSTPNFSFGQTHNGGSVAGVAFIRGVGQRDSHSAYDPAVGIYVDGVYMGRMYGNNLDMIELERVEVLRGPQGTLFGKNTSGGAINIITRQPDLSDATGRVQLTGGSYGRFDTIGNLNIPLVPEHLGLRVAASRLTRDGYGERVDFQEMADVDRTALRGQLLFRHNDFSALLSADWMEFDEKNASFKLLDVNTGVSPVAAYNAAFDPDYDDRWVSSRDYFFNSTGSNLARGHIGGASLTLGYDRPWAKLKAVTAYRTMDVDNALDPDGAPIAIINQFETVKQNQFSQELQATGQAFGDRLDWVLGAFYFREDVKNPVIYELLPALFNGSRNFSRSVPTANSSIAGFGQGSYSFNEQLRLTAGLRYTRDEKTVQSTQYGASGAVQFATPKGTHSSNSLSPRLGIDYRWTPEVMTYASVAQGAKNGGFNGRVARPGDFFEFDDEVVWTYELGMRSDLFDGRMRFNATAFYSRYTDLQLQIAGTTVVDGAPVGFAVVTNVPEATIHGGEVDLSVVAMPGLVFSGSLGLTHGQYTELPTDARFQAYGAVNKDSKFSNTPEVSYTLAAEYMRPFLDGLDLVARVDYAWKSEIFYNPENTPLLTQPSYGLLSARLTFETQTGLSVSIFGANLTDEAYFLGGFDDANGPNPGLGFSVVSQGAPREYGISAQLRF